MQNKPNPKQAIPALEQLVEGITDENRHPLIDWAPDVGIEVVDDSEEEVWLRSIRERPEILEKLADAALEEYCAGLTLPLSEADFNLPPARD